LTIKSNSIPVSKKCSLQNIKVQCHEYKEGKLLCLIHDTLFDVWMSSGGHKICNDQTITREKRKQIFIKDLSRLELDFEIEFTEKLIHETESKFSEIFKNRKLI